MHKNAVQTKNIQYYNVHKSELAKTTDVILNKSVKRQNKELYIYRIETDTG